MVSVDDADFIDERAMYENTDFCEPCGGGGEISYMDEHCNIRWFLCGSCLGTGDVKVRKEN